MEDIELKRKQEKERKKLVPGCMGLMVPYTVVAGTWRQASYRVNCSADDSGMIRRLLKQRVLIVGNNND
jgi:hypothetical protein